MQVDGTDGDGERFYTASAAVHHKSGLHGFSVRVRPDHPDLAGPFLPGLIAWACDGTSA
jgi:hypothetical protein